VIVQDVQFWTDVKLLLRVLEPVLKLLRLTDGKKGATLGKVYHWMCQLDAFFNSPIEGLPTAIREKVHRLFMARWAYFHEPIFTAAYMLDPEFIRVEHSADEETALRGIFEDLATEEHTEGKLTAEYAQFLTAVTVESHSMTNTGAFGESARKLQGFEWAQAYLYPWPSLKWLVMRVASLQCSASGCEHSWSVEGWIHSKKRNRLGQLNVERLVRTHTNLILEQILTDWEACILPWDIEMIVEEEALEADE
jgi:hypothetical protein